MSPHIVSLRVNLTQLQSEGVDITVPSKPETDYKTHGGFHYKTAEDEIRCPRGWNMENVTEAVKEYLASDRKRGQLKAIAIKWHTTPGSISGRIKRKKLL